MSTDKNTFWWAILRLVFAVIQIAGATASLIFVLESAPVWLISTCVGTTLLVTVISRILFSRSTSERGK